MSSMNLAAVSSGNITEDGVVSAVPSILWGLQLAIGSANSQLILYDNASGATGTVLARIMWDAVTEAGDNTQTIVFTQPINCVNGIYADWGGTGAIGTVWYNKK